MPDSNAQGINDLPSQEKIGQIEAYLLLLFKESH